MRDEQEDKLMKSLLLPLGKQSARAHLTQATCESRMEGAHGPKRKQRLLMWGVSVERRHALGSHQENSLPFLVRIQLTQWPPRALHYATLDSHKARPRGLVSWWLKCEQPWKSPPSVTWGLSLTGNDSEKSEVKRQVFIF